MNARGGEALLLAILAWAGCATAPAAGAGRRSVEAEGTAPADAPGAGERALADAQKRAIEKALGVSIAATTKVDGAIAVRRRIWADARGRVESWAVLSDRVVDGFRVVRIRAVVVRLADGDEVPPPADVTVRIEAAGPAGEGLRKGFGARGFTVVEKGGDFVVTARSGSELLRDARTAPFVTGRGRVTVSVTEAATGGVVWKRTAEASGLDSDPLAASALAVANAGEACGRDAADGLSRILWNR